MQPGHQKGTGDRHALSVTGTLTFVAATRGTGGAVALVARLHVDLRRVASAVCHPARGRH